MTESNCYECNDAEWDSEGCTCKRFHKHIGRPSENCTFKEVKRLTNGDRIRQMSDEELSVWLDNIGSCYVCKFYENKDVECNRSIDCCKDGMLKWLKSEVDSNEL